MAMEKKSTTDEPAWRNLFMDCLLRSVVEEGTRNAKRKSKTFPLLPTECANCNCNKSIRAAPPSSSSAFSTQDAPPRRCDMRSFDRSIGRSELVWRVVAKNGESIGKWNFHLLCHLLLFVPFFIANYYLSAIVFILLRSIDTRTARNGRCRKWTIAERHLRLFAEFYFSHKSCWWRWRSDKEDEFPSGNNSIIYLLSFLVFQFQWNSSSSNWCDWPDPYMDASCSNWIIFCQYCINTWLFATFLLLHSNDISTL